MNTKKERDSPEPSLIQFILYFVSKLVLQIVNKRNVQPAESMYRDKYGWSNASMKVAPNQNQR